MRTNFTDILQNKVEIPIIQRDYAQGRTDVKTTKIRRDFLDAIFGFVVRKGEDGVLELDLDFIYGLNKQGLNDEEVFVPIDGQQRLTTLWLLYWFVTAKENVNPKEKALLKNFIYETRHSTTQFCKSLVAFEPEFLQGSISFEIKNQPWYFETWNYDPGIQAMLVTLDDIERRYAEHSHITFWGLIGNTACPFYFYKLEMDKVGLTDDLYIKMNSRGKALTEFEYFKAGFTELLTESADRVRFERSIDGIWMETIWQIVFDGQRKNEDIAFIVDQAFLNLFNFITSVLSFKKAIKTEDTLSYYVDTVSTPELLRKIYLDTSNIDYLFDTLDNICLTHRNEPAFWEGMFYYGKQGFEEQKTRLYFQHGDTNLLNRCLNNYDQYRGLSYPEQLLLVACFTHFRSPQKDFKRRIRVVRNLGLNSDSELRESVLGKSFEEVEQYLLNGDLEVFKNFNRDQVEDEKQKEGYLNGLNQHVSVLMRLEDSEVFRGSISLIPLDDQFHSRAESFLKIFDEDAMISDYEEKCNLLLCFGNYSQKDRSLTNLLSTSKSDIRKFFTTPGYNKSQLHENTRRVVNKCLDFFTENPTVSAAQKIIQTVNDYDNSPKDWKYYFLKYPSFRRDCHYGYYTFTGGYPEWKMGKKQFNGYHWNPFLHEVYLSRDSKNVRMENYGNYDKLEVTDGQTTIYISHSHHGKGFEFEKSDFGLTGDTVLEELARQGLINEDHRLLIRQNEDGIDLEDRVKELKTIIKKITG